VYSPHRGRPEDPLSAVERRGGGGREPDQPHPHARRKCACSLSLLLVLVLLLLLLLQLLQLLLLLLLLLLMFLLHLTAALLLLVAGLDQHSRHALSGEALFKRLHEAGVVLKARVYERRHEASQRRRVVVAQPRGDFTLNVEGLSLHTLGWSDWSP
jgi:hypothetical protein